MGANPDVDAWFEQLEHPLKPVMQKVRKALTDADARLQEHVQYGTVQFSYKSGLCGFVQVKDPKRVTLMFNAANRLKGEFPHLQGKSVKYMYFTSDADFAESRLELQSIVRAWIDYKNIGNR
jgi:uncharacterized protein DUF1801